VFPVLDDTPDDTADEAEADDTPPADASPDPEHGQ
jgi:hypothetical protein